MKQKNNTSFFARVYDVVKNIPAGKVMTYGQIAKVLGAPRFSQIVGFALHQNPDPKHIPCHRVVNRYGEISSAFAFGGANQQRKLLEAEGVTFENDRVDLSKFQLNTLDFIKY